MGTQSLLYKRELEINDKIKIVIPTVGDVLKDEENYYDLVFILTASPIDMMVALDEAGIDFDSINDYDLFLLMFNEIAGRDTSMIFGDLDLSKFTLAISKENENIILVNRENDIIIDRAIHGKIASTLRRIHRIEKDFRKPANKEAREFMIERAKSKMKRERGRQKSSRIEPLIISLVNAEQYKYNFESTKDLTIYQFNECVNQINRKIEYDNRMRGVFAGTIDAKSLKPDQLTWIGNNK